jgi:anti-anti-sigma factor
VDQFRVGVTARGSLCELSVEGEVDLAVAEDLYRAAIKCLDTDEPGLIVDLAEVIFLDSTGIGALIRIRNHAVAAGKRLVLTNLSASVARVLNVTALMGAFEIDTELVTSIDGGRC